MDRKEIIRKYLIDNGFDGLCWPEQECGCTLHDLMPCECDLNPECCVPGHAVMRDDGDWIIVADTSATSQYYKIFGELTGKGKNDRTKFHKSLQVRQLELSGRSQQYRQF